MLSATELSSLVSAFAASTTNEPLPRCLAAAVKISENVVLGLHKKGVAVRESGSLFTDKHGAGRCQLPVAGSSAQSFECSTTGNWPTSTPLLILGVTWRMPSPSRVPSRDRAQPLVRSGKACTSSRRRSSCPYRQHPCSRHRHCGTKGREGQDFFPLTVDVEERMYAAGKIPGAFFRREGRATDQATLIARLIDRPLRPSFPDGFRNEVHVVATILGADQTKPPRRPVHQRCLGRVDVVRHPF